MIVRKPYFRVLYISDTSTSDITRDVSDSLIKIRYTDNTADSSDNISIELDDSSGLWRNEWYPQKGDKIDLEIGYTDLQFSCGQFEIDEITISGTPNRISIKGIASTFSSAMRSEDSSVHEGKTLRQIAEYIARKHFLQVQGDILNIRFNRITQNREKDLNFLNRLAKRFGYVFSIRANVLTFTSIYELDNADSVSEIKLSQMKPGYSFKDKLSSTYKSATVSYRNTNEDSVVDVNYDWIEGVLPSEVIRDTSDDVLIIKDKAENIQQAEEQAKAGLYFNNTEGQTARIPIEGDPLKISGNNVDIKGVGYFTGKYAIRSSTHTITKKGYTTDISANKVGNLPDSDKVTDSENQASSNVNVNIE